MDKPDAILLLLCLVVALRALVGLDFSAWSRRRSKDG